MIMTMLLNEAARVGTDIYMDMYITVPSDEWGRLSGVEMPMVDLDGHDRSTGTSFGLGRAVVAGAEGMNLPGVVSVCCSIVVGHEACEASCFR